MLGPVGDVLDLLSRPTYSHAQVDRILRLSTGTAQRWIDGYTRGGKDYPPVIRETATGDQVATWGEFVEARLLAEYRDAGVPMLRLRPAIEELRQQLGTSYPLASAKLWLEPTGRELVERVQAEVHLESKLAMVVIRTHQQMLDPESRLQWSDRAEHFRRSVRWAKLGGELQPTQILPMSDNSDVVIDPLRGFGEPVVRSVPTGIIAELIRAGDPPAMIAELYELPRPLVDAAVRYELSRLPA